MLLHQHKICEHYHIQWISWKHSHCCRIRSRRKPFDESLVRLGLFKKWENSATGRLIVVCGSNWQCASRIWYIIIMFTLKGDCVVITLTLAGSSLQSLKLFVDCAYISFSLFHSLFYFQPEAACYFCIKVSWSCS